MRNLRIDLIQLRGLPFFSILVLFSPVVELFDGPEVCILSVTVVSVTPRVATSTQVFTFS